jgi:formate hydrogenlyase subunit 3/multisubunit Na+/H+ antiporter MnhD subunit
MFVLIFALPFAAALLCLGLNRAVPTRWLGIVAAAVLLLTAGALLLAPLAAQPERIWATLGERPVRLALAFDAVSWPFALLALAGGALALLALALALPPDLRGFGGLFAALLVGLDATIAGLANQEPLLLPFAWAIVALLGFVALRASGTIARAAALPVGLFAGLAVPLLLVAAALTSVAPPGAALAPATLVCWTLVILLAFGAPAFHALFNEPAESPAALAAVLLPLGLPLLGGYALVRFTMAQWSAIPPAWRIAWALLGLLTVLACAAGAASATRLRRLVGWQLSAQLGLVLLSIGLPGALPPVVGAAGLLMNAMLTTLAGYLAIAFLERRAGTDDLAEIGAHGPLLLPGLAFLFAAASASGLPGTWGWWEYRALFSAARAEAPWLLPPLLASGVLRALAYAAPLAAFWRRPFAGAATPGPRHGWPTLAVMLCSALAALPLLIWGVAPQIAWRGWLAAAQDLVRANSQEQFQPDAPEQIAVALAAFGLVVLPLLGLRGRRRCPPVDQEGLNPALLTPEALGQSLRWLIWLGDPAGLFGQIWDGLLRLSRAASRLLALFEQRYYLAGLMIAIIVVIMLMI